MEKRLSFFTYSQDQLLGDSARCLFMGARRFHWGARVLDRLIGQADSRLCDSMSKATGRVMTSGLKSGGKEFAVQAIEKTISTPQRSIALGTAAMKRTSDELKLKHIASGLLDHIWRDKELAAHIQQKYGGELQRRLGLSLQEFFSQVEVNESIMRIGKKGESLFHKVLGSLLLNSEGSGPNPLLVTLVKEELSGIRRLLFGSLQEKVTSVLQRVTVCYDRRPSLWSLIDK